MLRMSFRSARPTQHPTQRADTRLPSIRHACASTHSNWMSRMPFCYAMERPSLSRRSHSRCFARWRATPGCLVTKNALLDLVWGHRFVTESVLKTAVSEVRAALDDDPKQPRCIETVSRRGYRFIAATIGASSQRAPAIERNVAAGRDHPALTALTALCRGDAAVAEVIRAVAATLEREPLVLNES